MPTRTILGDFWFFGKHCRFMMTMQCIFIFSIVAWYFIFFISKTQCKAMPLEELVVDLGGNMSTSDSTKLVVVEECIINSEVTMIYLQEGGLLPYMDGMVKHNEVILMKFYQTWKDRKVTVNGMSFEISEENIVRAGDFSLYGNKWQRQAKISEEASLQIFFKSKEEPMRLHGGYAWATLPKPWDTIFYVIIRYITLEDCYQVLYNYHFSYLESFQNS